MDTTGIGVRSVGRGMDAMEYVDTYDGFRVCYVLPLHHLTTISISNPGSYHKESPYRGQTDPISYTMPLVNTITNGLIRHRGALFTRHASGQ